LRNDMVIVQRRIYYLWKFGNNLQKKNSLLLQSSNGWAPLQRVHWKTSGMLPSCFSEIPQFALHVVLFSIKCTSDGHISRKQEWHPVIAEATHIILFLHCSSVWTCLLYWTLHCQDIVNWLHLSLNTWWLLNLFCSSAL
jgi:hypothetical protein